MANGKHPFVGNTGSVVFEAMMNLIAPSSLLQNPEIPQELELLIQKALEKDRDVRCQTAAEIGADLRRLLRDSSSGKVPAAVPASNSTSVATETSAPSGSGAAMAAAPAPVSASAPVVAAPPLQPSAPYRPPRPSSMPSIGTILFLIVIIGGVLAYLKAYQPK